MNINMGRFGSFNINGSSFKGNNISIINGKVTIDGKVQKGSYNEEINITVDGDVKSIDNGVGNVVAKNVGEVNTGSGDVRCMNVTGSVRTGSGDVSCNDVAGSIRTGSGDVSHRH